MVVDFSSRERKALILNPVIKELYEGKDDKYEKFVTKLYNTFCGDGGHETVQPDNYTTGSCKFKKDPMRGIGFVIDDGNVSIAVVTIAWHKNIKKKISGGQMNAAKNKARSQYKELDKENTDGLNAFIDSAIENAEKLVLEC